MAVGYNSNNISDQFKHANLEQCVRSLPTDHLTYVEFHAGIGQYDGYDGSGLRVIKTLEKMGRSYDAILHEKKESNRIQLEGHVSGYRDSLVLEDWQQYVAEYVAQADDYYLFLLDPTKIKDYTGKKGLLRWLVPLLRTGASLFLFVPENHQWTVHSDILKAVHRSIQYAGRCALDLSHPAGRGFLKRTDHNIVVASRCTQAAVQQQHHALYAQFQQNRRSRFTSPGQNTQIIA